MRKIFLILSIFFFVFINTSFSQTYPAGWDCAHPLLIPSLPFSASSLSSQPNWDFYNAYSCTQDTAFMSGKDFVMMYHSPYVQYIKITTGFTWQGYVGLFVFDNCPDIPNSCVATASTGLSMTGPSITNVLLNANVDYYIVVSTNHHQSNVPDYTSFSPNITESVRDGGINLVSSPVSGCGLTNNELVQVRIKNFSTNAISNFPIKYRINNGPIISETYTAQIAANATANYTFTTHADLSLPGTYVIKAYTEVLADHAFTNDTTIITINNTHGVSNYSYSQNFDNANTYWTVGGTNPSWIIRHPHKTIINQALTDTSCFITNAYGNCNVGENSYIESPCFDMTLLSNPVLNMAVWYENASDGAAFFSSIDNGATWQLVADNAGSTNWYNATNQWSGNSHKWLLVKRNIIEFAHKPNVRFRLTFQSTTGSVEGFGFDNFKIEECSPMPAAAFAFANSSNTVTFTNTTTGANYFAWDFGDGSNSTQFSPSHTYAASGTFIVKLIATNSCGSDTITQLIDVVTGIQKSEMPEISINPNPSTDIVNIQLSNVAQHSELTITTIQGKLIVKKEITGNIRQFTFDNLSRGIYFVKLSADKQVLIKKLVIE